MSALPSPFKSPMRATEGVVSTPYSSSPPNEPSPGPNKTEMELLCVTTTSGLPSPSTSPTVSPEIASAVGTSKGAENVPSPPPWKK